MDVARRLIAPFIALLLLIPTSSFASAIFQTSTPVTLESIEIDGPTSVDSTVGEWVNWAAVLHYSDGSSLRSDHVDFFFRGDIDWTMSGGHDTSQSGSWLRVWGTELSSATTPITVTASYTENGVTRSTTQTVTVVQPPAVNLERIEITGPSTVDPSLTTTYTWSALLYFSDGTSANSRLRGYDMSWTLSAGAIESQTYDHLTLSASNFASATGPVTIVASYTHNGITRTDSHTVTLPAGPVTLESVVIDGADSYHQDYPSAIIWSFTATYSDGTTRDSTDTSDPIAMEGDWRLTGGLTHTGRSSMISASASLLRRTTEPTTITLSFTDGGITRTATLDVGPQLVLMSVEIVGSTVIREGETLQYEAFANYTNGTRAPITASWSLTGVARLTADGALTAREGTAGSTLTLAAAYQENGVTRTTSTEVTVAGPALVGIEISGPSRIDAGESARYTVFATYEDGTRQEVTPSWSALGRGATITRGLLTIDEDTDLQQLELIASYTEYGVSSDDSLNIEIVPPAPPADDTTASNLIVLSHNNPDTSTFREGDDMVVEYTLSGFPDDQRFDIVMAVSPPEGPLLFMSTTQQRSTPLFTRATSLFMEDQVIVKQSGELVAMTIPARGLPRGSYPASNLIVLSHNNPDTSTFREGDDMVVEYTLSGFPDDQRFDIVMAVSPPEGPLLFMSTTQQRSTPLFTRATSLFMEDQVIVKQSGELVAMTIPARGLPRGSYRFYAVSVASGSDPIDPANWIGGLASLDVIIE